MSAEEQRLSRLLKMAVPEPPIEMSADQVTTRPADQSVKSWALPALAAAAVVAIGVTIGAVVPRDAGPAGPTTLGATGTRQTAASTQPQPTATCQGATVVVPNVIGTTEDAAAAIVQGAGLNVGGYYAVPPASQAVAPGTVFAQSPPAGSRAVPGALVYLAIAMAPPTSTAPPIDPGSVPTGSPSPMSPCQAIAGTPPAQGTDARVPSVVGMPRAQAVAVAEQVGFNVSVTVAAPPTRQSVPPGTVFAQSPAAGSAARPRSGMILYIAPTP